MQIRPVSTADTAPIAAVVPNKTGHRLALVMAPLPPLINTTAAHASAMVHLLRQADYQVVTATGPGLALARNQITFASESKFRSSMGFLNADNAPEQAVVYARVFDFSRISKPRWYKRRLEEIRRIRCLTRIIRTSGATTLVMDDRPWLNRTQITQFLVARAVSFVTRKRLTIVKRSRRPDRVMTRIDGAVLPVPDAHAAEESVYAAAFNPGEDAPRIPLTSFRAEQALDYWCSRHDTNETVALRRDVAMLVALSRRHDFRELPQFRLLAGHPKGGRTDPATFGTTPTQKTGNAIHPVSDRVGVPITRYMMHLRASACLEDRFPLQNRADARRFLAWYLQEAAEITPDGCVPVPDTLRRFFLKTARGAVHHDLPTESGLSHTIGRDSRPFSLSPILSRYYAETPDLRARFDIDDPIDRIGFVLFVLLTLSDDVALRPIAGAAADFLTEPLGGDGFNVTRLEFVLALQARFEMADADAVERPWANGAIRQWARHAILVAFPTLLPLARPAPQVNDIVHRATIAGLPRSETGVGSNLHMSRLAFREAGIVPRIRDVADGLREVPRPDTAPARLRLKRNIALHHINADRIPQTLMSPQFGGQRATYHIGFLLWEFTELPEAHRLALDMLDEVWTPSRFLRGVYGRASRIPVRNMLKGLHIPETVPADLGEYGVPDGATTFMACFDFHSSVARKNPWAAVTAFQAAFPATRDDVRLIIKTTPIVENHWGDPERQIDRIRAAAARDPRIILIAEYLPFADLLGLISAVDCLVSPHRAEGFGLMPAYALGLGTAVIATDYSGTTDFCDAKTSYPVPYKMVGIAPNQALYPMENAQWAEIDTEACAAAMANVADKPEIGRIRAAAGHKLIHSRYTTARQAVRYRRRLEELGII